MALPLGSFSLDRIFEAVETVRRRLLRAVKTLESAGVPYAVVGGHAVAFWVERNGKGGVRNTPDVDILVRRADLEAATEALIGSGFVPGHVKGVNLFLDGPGAKPRDAVHVIFAGEKVRPEHLFPAPDLGESEPGPLFQVLALPALIRMKLTSFRLKDRVHLLDLIDVGLIDQSTVATVPPELAPRLQELIDNPES